MSTQAQQARPHQARQPHQQPQLLQRHRQQQAVAARVGPQRVRLVAVRVGRQGHQLPRALQQRRSSRRHTSAWHLCC